GGPGAVGERRKGGGHRLLAGGGARAPWAKAARVPRHNRMSQPLCPQQVLRQFVRDGPSTTLAHQKRTEPRRPPTACAPQTTRIPTTPPKPWPMACPSGERPIGETTIGSIRSQVQ